jgi:hypothetical protein
MISVDDYKEVKDCTYKDEHYSARDNGAIMRHLRKGMRKRKLDEVWSFGTPNVVTGYMDFCGERVHRIVATAFHGEAPSSQHVVDHIDTNRHNNRPDNLRWLTKLENILCNEITRKKVELICGSVEAFLNDPTLLFGYETEDKNFSWMKNVTPEEAKNCLDNWKHWAKTAAPNPNYKKEEHHVGDWIFDKPINVNYNRQKNTAPLFVDNVEAENKKIDATTSENTESNTIDTEEWLTKMFGKKGGIKEEPEYDGLYDSLTPSAKQRYWRTPTEFPCCPAEVTDKSLEVYKDNLKEGELFSSNSYDKYYVIDKAIIPDKNDLIVLCTNNEGEQVFGAYALCSVKIEKGKLVHMSIRRYGSKDVATHFFNLIIGKEEWTEDDMIWWDT